MLQQIREVMTPNPVTLPGTTSVQDAARAMQDADRGDVVVIKHNQVCGIVTDLISSCGPWPRRRTRPPPPWPTSAVITYSP